MDAADDDKASVSDRAAPGLPALWHAPEPPADAVAILARRYQRAESGGMALLNRLGGRLEDQLAALPAPMLRQIETLTRRFLIGAYGAATVAPGLGRIGARGQIALASAAGAAGGAGGIATAIAELPVTLTLILGAVQDVAAKAGFDPRAEPTRRECLRVFGAGGPLSRDDGVDTAFIAARLTLTGPAIGSVLAAVVPRLATSMGQKLLAQSVPVIGAVAGAGLNAAYLHYYREMAAVRFGLIALAASHDPDRVIAAFHEAVASERAPARR
jgi:hypothetical protein